MTHPYERDGRGLGDRHWSYRRYPVAHCGRFSAGCRLAALHLYGVFAIVFVIAAGCLLLLKPSTSQAQPALAQA